LEVSGIEGQEAVVDVEGTPVIAVPDGDCSLRAVGRAGLLGVSVCLTCVSQRKAQWVQQGAGKSTHLGGRLPLVEGSSFLLPVLALPLIVSSAIMDFGGRDWPCSVLTVRTGDGMAAPVLS
jgi:hypothetical protein